MKAVKIENSIIDGYLKLSAGLSTSNKLDLIAKLSMAIKSEQTNKDKVFNSAFGGWSGEETAEELINQIRSSRVFNREIENL